MDLPWTIVWCAFAVPCGLGAGLAVMALIGVDVPLAIRAGFPKCDRN